MAEIVPLHPSRSFDPEPLWREALGRRLRGIRHVRGDRLVDTAGRAGVSPQYLSELERGMKDPSSEMIAAVAGALDVHVVELVSAVAADLGARTTGDAAVGVRGAYSLAA